MKKYRNIEYKSLKGNHTHFFERRMLIDEAEIDYDKEDYSNYFTYHDKITLKDCYEKWSDSKERIWNEWNTVCEGRLTVSSFNSNFFTIKGVAELINLETGEISNRLIYVTSKRNEVIA